MVGVKDFKLVGNEKLKMAWIKRFKNGWGLKDFKWRGFKHFKMVETEKLKNGGD